MRCYVMYNVYIGIDQIISNQNQTKTSTILLKKAKPYKICIYIVYIQKKKNEFLFVMRWFCVEDMTWWRNNKKQQTKLCSQGFSCPWLLYKYTYIYIHNTIIYNKNQNNEKMTMSKEKTKGMADWRHIVIFIWVNKEKRKLIWIEGTKAIFDVPGGRKNWIKRDVYKKKCLCFGFLLVESHYTWQYTYTHNKVK